MNAIYSTIPLLSIIGVIQGLILSIILYLKGDLKTNGNKLLSLIFAIFALTMLVITMSNSGLVSSNLLFDIIEKAVSLLMGPILYYWIMGFDQKSANQKGLILHLIPFFAFLIFRITGTFQDWPTLPIVFFMLHLQFYTLLSIYVLFKSESGENGRDNYFAWSLLIFMVFLHLAQWIRFTFSDYSELALIVPFTASAGIYIITIVALTRSTLLEIKLKARKYRKSGINEQDSVAKWNQIVTLMESDTVFTDSSFTLGKLSDLISLHPNYVSQVINQNTGKTFFDLITKYRLQKAREMLRSHEKSHYSIEAIAYESGFKSRSSFYTRFKKEFNTTPSAYRSEFTKAH